MLTTSDILIEFAHGTDVITSIYYWEEYYDINLTKKVRIKNKQMEKKIKVY